MRWLFVLVTVILLQVLSYRAGRGLQWWAEYWLNPKQARVVFWIMMLISNSLLVVGLARFSSMGLRFLMTWLVLLWFIIMAMVVAWSANQFLGRWWQDTYQSDWFNQLGVRLLMMGAFVGMIAMGLYNAYTPVVRHLTVTVNQPLTSPMKIAMVSDLHLGSLFGNRELDLLTNVVKQEKAQLLLIPGDVMDDNTEQYDKKGMQPHLQNLVKALPLGVYATLGNHDLFGHDVEIRKALQQAGVHVLIDEKALVNNQLWLVGRLDDLVETRKPTAEILPTHIDKPVILLDHRPSDIDKNVKLPIDLQVSGHTHNGQIFPANFIVKLLNTVGYGHQRINQTDVLVSSGYGFWGIPFRLGSQSEIWIIDLMPASVKP